MVSQLLCISPLQRSDTICKWLGHYALSLHLIRIISRRFCMSRAQLTVHILQGITIDEFLGSLQAWSETKWFASLVAIQMTSITSTCLRQSLSAVIFRQRLQSMHLKMTLLWFLRNFIRAMDISAEW
jgi:hypothetical protein